ncbi:DUF6864 domain-containing function [Parashewanella tropica]|uniref:DUF6864 domain-containing function n=1 Tax=Parashewanella tropica TaxID=2547970 RepID=UPI00105A2C14|nr:hypothetical protein [Parashewanella tropica]
MIKINNLELSCSAFILIHEKQAEIETVVDNWPIKISFEFAETQHTSTSISWTAADDNHAHIQLVNWQKMQTSSMAKPALLGTTNTSNRNIYITLCGQAIGNVYRLDIQLLLGAANA